MTLGIIDVGTNSIHLLIGILGLNGRFHTIVKERDLTRLGEGGLVKGKLTRSSMARAMAVLKRYASVLQRCGADRIEAVATSAAREAANGRVFVRRVRRQLKLPLRIISGRTEARLIYLGVLQAHRFRGSTAIISIGGGSAQVMCGDGARMRYLASVPLGGARLAQQFIRHDPPQPQEVARLLAHVRHAWAPCGEAMRRFRFREALGSSATIAQVALAAYIAAHGRAPAKGRPVAVTQAALRRLVEWLANSTAKERIQLEGLDPRREDLALPTAVSLLGWMKACGVPAVRYAPGSLREGLVMDFLLRHHQRLTEGIEPLPTERLFANGAELPRAHRKRLLRRLVKHRGHA